jgi:CheY-like chemotaxis protein
VNTIGLAERELNDLLERLDDQQPEGEASPIRRDFARWPFRQASIALRVMHPGGSEVELRLACRNLSNGGICLLHNGFLHCGTACHVLLPRSAGGVEEVAGEICRCAHRRGTLHEIGVKFNQPVDLKRFIQPDQAGEVFTLERVAPEKLKGRVLLVDDCAMSVRIVQHFLRETELLVTHAKTGEEALSGAPASFDIVLVAGTLPDMSAAIFLARLREMGPVPCVIIMSTDPASVAGLIDNGKVGVLSKPLEHDAVLRSLAERLLVSPRAAGKQRAAATAVATIPPELLDELRRTATALRRAAAEQNAAAALPLCLILKGAAGSFSHADLASAANKAVVAMTGDPSASGRFSIVQRLCETCESAFAAAPGSVVPTPSPKG